MGLKFKECQVQKETDHRWKKILEKSQTIVPPEGRTKLNVFFKLMILSKNERINFFFA